MLPIEINDGERPAQLIRLAMERNVETLRQASDGGDDETCQAVLAVLKRLDRHAREDCELDLPLYRARLRVEGLIDRLGPGQMDEDRLARVLVQQLGIARNAVLAPPSGAPRMSKTKERKRCPPKFR